MGGCTLNFTKLTITCLCHMWIQPNTSIISHLSKNVCSSISARFKSYFGWIYRKWRQSCDRKWSRAHAQPVSALFSYYSSSTKCIIAHDRHGYRKWPKFTWPRRVPWKGVRSFRPSGTFSPLMTSSNVTRNASRGTGSHVIGSAIGVISRTSGSYNLIIFYELAQS